MPVLTGAALKAAGLEGHLKRKAAPVEIPAVAEAPKAIVPKDGWRMHHPDDPFHTMDCIIAIGAEEVHIKKGIALVGEETAKELERRGWLRGAKVEDYEYIQ